MEKKLDMIIGYNPTQKGAEFGSDYNKAIILTRNKKPRELPRMLKSDLANEILDELARLLKSKTRQKTDRE